MYCCGSEVKYVTQGWTCFLNRETRKCKHNFYDEISRKGAT